MEASWSPSKALRMGTRRPKALTVPPAVLPNDGNSTEPFARRPGTQSDSQDTPSAEYVSDLEKQILKLRKENNALKMENCHLFKELDSRNRRLLMKHKPHLVGASVSTLNKSQIFTYSIDAKLSYSMSLEEFLQKFNRDYPETKALVAIVPKGRDRQHSIAVRSDSGARASSSEAVEIETINRLMEQVALVQQKVNANREISELIFDSLFDDEQKQWRNELGVLSEEDIIDIEDSDENIDREEAQAYVALDSTVIVSRQFARDVPSLLRINGKPPQGATDNDKVINAYRALVAQTNGNKKALKLIMQLANQSLGIILYEKLVANYVEMNLVVKQSWQHYLDIAFLDTISTKK